MLENNFRYQIILAWLYLVLVSLDVSGGHLWLCSRATLIFSTSLGSWRTVPWVILTAAGHCCCGGVVRGVWKIYLSSKKRSVWNHVSCNRTLISEFLSLCILSELHITNSFYKYTHKRVKFGGFSKKGSGVSRSV